MKYIDVPMTYFRSKFYMPNANCLLIENIKIKAYENVFDSAEIIYILENIIFIKVADVVKI